MTARAWEARALPTELPPRATTEADLPRRLLKLKEVAEFCRVHPSTIRSWVRTGRLKALRLGGRAIRFDPEDVRRLGHGP